MWDSSELFPQDEYSAEGEEEEGTHVVTGWLCASDYQSHPIRKDQIIMSQLIVHNYSTQISSPLKLNK